MIVAVSESHAGSRIRELEAYYHGQSTAKRAIFIAESPPMIGGYFYCTDVHPNGPNCCEARGRRLNGGLMGVARRTGCVVRISSRKVPDQCDRRKERLLDFSKDYALVDIFSTREEYEALEASRAEVQVLSAHPPSPIAQAHDIVGILIRGNVESAAPLQIFDAYPKGHERTRWIWKQLTENIEIEFGGEVEIVGTRNNLWKDSERGAWVREVVRHIVGPT